MLGTDAIRTASTPAHLPLKEPRLSTSERSTSIPQLYGCKDLPPTSMQHCIGELSQFTDAALSVAQSINQKLH